MVNKQIENFLEARKPAMRRPKLKIFDVPTDEEIAEDIRKQNFEDISSKDFGASFKKMFKVGPRNMKTVHWVIEAVPELRQRIVKSGGKIFIGWSACKTVDYAITTRCYRCQRFGHQANTCKAATDTCGHQANACKAATDTCGHCAREGHSYKDCAHKEQEPRCSNCVRRKIDHRHEVNSSECAIFIK